MDIGCILENNNIEFNEIEYESCFKLFKLKKYNKLIVEIISKNKDFFIDRDLFYYLDNNDEDYIFILKHLGKKKIYYLEFKSKNNWLKKSFERTDKDTIFFGKIILNCEINSNELEEKILKSIL